MRSQTVSWSWRNRSKSPNSLSYSTPNQHFGARNSEPRAEKNFYDGQFLQPHTGSVRLSKPDYVFSDIHGSENFSNQSRSLQKGKSLFSSMPSLFQSDPDKKAAKKERKKAKELLKLREKEEKNRRKLEQKQTKSGTLPRNWCYLSGPVEGVCQVPFQPYAHVHHNQFHTYHPQHYPSAACRLHVVPINFEETPAGLPQTGQLAYAPISSVNNSNFVLRKKILCASVPDLHESVVEDNVNSGPYSPRKVSLERVAERNDTPRVVILRRMPDGYGFVLRGAKSRTHLGDLNFTPTPEVPALQYLESVDKGSSADKSRLLAGDFLLEINGESVTRASHERVVQLIRSSGDILRMKVLSVGGAGSSIATNQRPASPDWYHRCATARSYQGSTGKRPAPTPPHRDPATSLSYSRATSKSVSDVFTEIDHLDQMIAGFDQQPSSSIRSHSMLNVDCVGVTGCENKVASVRAARAMKRMSVCDVGGDAGRGLLASSFIRNADHAPKMSPAEMRINKYYKKGNPAGSQHRPQSVVGLVGAYAPTGVRPAANGGGPDAGEISSTRWRTPALGQPLASNNSADEADVVGTGCDVATSSAHKNSPVKDCADRAEVVCIDTGRASMSKVVDIAEESMRAAGNITSFHSGTKSRLRDDPPGPLRPVELPGSSYSSSGYSGDHAEPASHYRSSCVSFAEDHVHDSASAFLRKHPEARLIVTSDIYVDSTDNGVSHQSAARGVAPYEPEPDYGSDSGDDVTSSTLATSHFTTTSSYEHSWRGDAVSTDRYQPATCNAVISSAGLPCNIARDGNGAPVSLTSVTGLSNVHVNPPTEVQARAAVDRSEHMRSDDLYHRSPPPDHPPPPPPASMTGVHAQKYRYASVLHQDSQQPAGAQCEPGESSLPPAPVISSADILEAVLTRKKRIEENGVQMKQLSGSSPVPRLLDRNIEALKAAVERRRRCLEGNSTTPVEDIEARLGKMHTLRSPSGVETKLKIPGKEWVGRQSNGIHGSTTSNSAGGGGDENSVCGNVNDSSSRNEAHLSLLDCMSSKPGSDCAQSGSTPSEGDPVTNRSVSALSKIFESPGWSNDNSACQKTETPPARDFPTATSSSDASMILVGKSSADKLQHTSVPVTHSDTLTNHSVTEVVVKRLPAGKHCAASGKDSTTLVSHRSTAVQSLATTGNTSLADSSCPANGVSRTTDSQPPSTGVAPSLRYPVATLARKKPKEIMSHNASVKPPVSCPSVKKPAERYNAKGGSENGGLPVTRNSAITSSPVGVLCPVSASCPAETSSPQHVAATPLSRSDQLKSDDLLVKAEKARLAYLHKVSSSSPMKVGVSRADNTSSSSQSGLICTTTLPVSTRPSRNVDSSIMVSRLNSVNMLSAASAKTDSAVVDNAKCTRAKLLYEPFGGRQSSTTGESNGSHVDQIHGDTLDGDDGLGGDGVSLDLRQLSIEIIPPPPSFRMTRMNGTKSSLDDSSSLVSSISSLSTLSSEPGESVQAGSFGQPADDVLTLCPPRGYDSLNVMTTSVPVIDSCIPPPDQFSGDSHIQELAKKAFLRNPVEKWKCADVFDWLESLGMGQYKDSFARLSVDGRRLVSLERNDYIELGVLEVSHRIDLQRSIMRLIINGETLI